MDSVLTAIGLLSLVIVAAAGIVAMALGGVARALDGVTVAIRLSHARAREGR